MKTLQVYAKIICCSKNKVWRCANRECSRSSGVPWHPQAYGVHHSCVELSLVFLHSLWKNFNTKLSPISFSMSDICKTKIIQAAIESFKKNWVVHEVNFMIYILLISKECIKQRRTDSDRKLRATFRELFDHLDTSEIFANLRDYRGWNYETLGANMSAMQHTELPIWFLWWKVFCRKLQLHMWLRISRHPRWVKLGTLLKTSETKQRENSLATAKVQKEKPKKIKGK